MDHLESATGEGRTLLDWFAGHAPNPNEDWTEQWARHYLQSEGRGFPRKAPDGRASSLLLPNENLLMLAAWRFSYAAAMLAEREKTS